TAYGDLDASILRQVPPGRRLVETRLVGEEERATAYQFVRSQLRQGRQAYVVCPLVSESEKLQGKAAEDEAERLAAGELRGFKLAVIHGQMPAARKQEAMEAFAAGAVDVLVATTVIEVGIDVRNATVMLIEGAERYGVSQLHQLRGRVGRGDQKSYCLLFSGGVGRLARRRLEAVVRERDGFKLAELDLAIRGEGEMFGTRQHGLPRFRIAELSEDPTPLLAAREEVLGLLRRYESLDVPELGPLMSVAYGRFGVGAGERVAL
ncbi:MAG: helicase-related protein, partial [Solirubrobacterales bacterium]